MQKESNAVLTLESLDAPIAQETVPSAGNGTLRFSITHSTPILLVAGSLLALPLADEYWYSAILIPWLVLSLAGLGLNLLTGYAGQLSLGSAAFMAVGAFAAYNFNLRIPGLPLLLSIFFGGVLAAGVGVLFGLPSLRVRGFYLIASTLAAQFFVQWALTKFSWFSGDNPSGVISAPPLVILNHDFSTPQGRYLLTAGIVIASVLLASNLIRSPLGRDWMAVRDMETAASVMGVSVFKVKLYAFALSSFFCGIAGALWAFAYVGTIEPHGMDLNRSFQVLFIVIIGGLGSIAGSFLGAAFIVLLPILLSHAVGGIFAGYVDAGNTENLQKILIGVLILAFLIREPEGLARLFHVVAQRLRIKLARQTPPTRTNIDPDPSHLPFIL